MDLAYKQEATVGALVIAACVLFFLGVNYLGGHEFSLFGRTPYRILFDNAAGLKASSVVRIAGVQKGKVKKIELRDRKVLVSVSLEKDVVPKDDATAAIVGVGLVGDAAIDLSPGTSSRALDPERDIIIGGLKAGLTDRAAQLSDRADSVLLGAQRIVNQKTADELYETMNQLQATLKTTQHAMQTLSDPRTGPTAELNKTMIAFRSVLNRLDSTLADPALKRTLGRADTLTANLAAMTAQLTTTGARLDSVLTGVNSGRGSLGKFATDSGFYTDLRELSQSMKRLLDELQKHPGKVPVTVKLF